MNTVSSIASFIKVIIMTIIKSKITPILPTGEYGVADCRILLRF
jgi:hypothetical protein